MTRKLILGRLTSLLVVLPLLIRFSAESFNPEALSSRRPTSVINLVSLESKSIEKNRKNGSLSLNNRLSRQGLVLQIASEEISEAEKPNEKTLDNEKTPEAPTIDISDIAVSKFRRLKDIMWIREAVEDVTAAEFACSVEAGQKANRKQKRAVDYEKLLSQLNRRVGDLICLPFEEVNGSEPEIMRGQGMGRFVYDHEQRVAMLKRIMATREKVVSVMTVHNPEEKDDEFGIQLPEIPDLSIDIPKEEDSSSSSGPKLYVRDDGTVDWDGALQDRAALKKFGSAVWARINGQNADEISEDDDELEKAAKSGHGEKAVTAKIEDTPEIVEAREKLNEMKQNLKDLQKSHTALLNSGISAGQPVANVKLASLGPELRTKIRLSAEALDTLEQEVSFQELVYELERIYTYLATELGSPSAKGYLPFQDRLNVAEYGLLESQVASVSRDREAKGALDVDILAVIAEQMTDFKRRLGIDYYISGVTYDKEALQTWLSDVLIQTKSGLAFYVKGCRLFWNDLLYCTSLFARAAQGYTLKPREVRNLRRTFKDIITFIPFIIILLIPLSPIGHVFVFGAIQRFFPDFFPSCFTEQRQNLLQLYETTEFSEFTINENFRERFSRFLEAVGFTIANQSRLMYISLMGKPENMSSDDKQ